MKNKFVKKLFHTVRKSIILLKGEIQMRLAIREVKSLHAKENETRYNERENRQFLVLLKVPKWKKDGRCLINEKLVWVNRRNYRNLKYISWLPPEMDFAELHRKAFYISDPKRSYQSEYNIQQKAIHKYIEYLKETLS